MFFQICQSTRSDRASSMPPTFHFNDSQIRALMSLSVSNFQNFLYETFTTSIISKRQAFLVAQCFVWRTRSVNTAARTLPFDVCGTMKPFGRTSVTSTEIEWEDQGEHARESPLRTRLRLLPQGACVPRNQRREGFPQGLEATIKPDSQKFKLVRIFLFSMRIFLADTRIFLIDARIFLIAPRQAANSLF